MHTPKNILELYSGDDLTVLFKGGFINFGYWDNITLQKDKLSYTDITHANRALYKKTFDPALIKETDRVLEVGSGFGAGCSLLAQLFRCQSVTGVDYFQAHVDRSNKLHKELISQKKISFLRGNAENLPIADQTIDKLLTVEAFQHFKSKESINEFSRVLANNGILVISTFFVLNKDYFSQVLQLLPRPAILSDKDSEENAALPEILQTLHASGFKNIEFISIGQHIWQGYDKWVRQNQPGIWDINWLKAYREGLLDYFIIKANKN